MASTRSPETASDTTTTLSAAYFCGFRFPLAVCVRPWSHVGHVFRTENGGHLGREREEPDMAQEIDAKRRVLAD
jgi:hypothetical protein